MASIPKEITPSAGQKFLYTRNPRHASFNFNQESSALYRNQPRLPFEYYIDIRLNDVGTASSYIDSYFNNPDWQQVTPLVKSVEMPSFKIETTALNQYNRKRISQTKIGFDPVKIVFHDVADGKTLKFWEMYYRYYFGDGTEPGVNEPKQTQQKNKTYTIEEIRAGMTPPFNPNVSGLSASVKNSFRSNAPTGANSPTNTNGSKRSIENIVADTLDNHNFGFNLPTVKDIRYLIQTINIFQVHGGKFNQVTLVNPRIASFTHDTLSYAEGTKTLELTFTFEYEYAYYTIQNMDLGGRETNNNSSLEPFEHGDYLEIPKSTFNASLNFLKSNNPVLESANPISSMIGKNIQSSISGVAEQFSLNNLQRRFNTGSIDALARLTPAVYSPVVSAVVTGRPFDSTALLDSPMYRDVNRTISDVNSIARRFGG